MIGLLKGEYYKLVRTTSFWVILIILVLFGMGMPILEKMLAEQMENLSQEDRRQIDELTNSIPEGVSTGIQIEMQPLESDRELNAIHSLTSAFGGNNLQLFIALFATLFLVMEYSTGCMKIIVSRGFKRSKVLASKLIAICSANALFVAVFVLGYFTMSYVVWGMGEVPEGFGGKLLTLVFLQLVGIIAYSTLSLMVASLIRSTALSLVVNIIIVSLGGNVFFLMDLMTKERFHIARYWVINAMSESASLSLTRGDVFRNFMTMAVTFTLTLVVGIAAFRKTDVK